MIPAIANRPLAIGNHAAPARPRRVWICVNGILANPGASDGWTDRAVTWLHLQTGDQAEKFEYAAGVLSRRIKQRWRAAAIAKMAGYYLRAGYEISFVAHSNGADLVERVLAYLSASREIGQVSGSTPFLIRSAHLFAPACDGTELAAAVDDDRLGTLHLYGSENDLALRLATWSRRLLAPVNALLSVVGGPVLGYGDLGRRLAEYGTEHPYVWIHEDPAETHGSWFARGAPFERTMRQILTNDQR